MLLSIFVLRNAHSYLDYAVAPRTSMELSWRYAYQSTSATIEHDQQESARWLGLTSSFRA
jgi:hypothetical protein